MKTVAIATSLGQSARSGCDTGRAAWASIRRLLELGLKRKWTK